MTLPLSSVVTEFENIAAIAGEVAAEFKLKLAALKRQVVMNELTNKKLKLPAHKRQVYKKLEINSSSLLLLIN